jgi:hypothetical protein
LTGVFGKHTIYRVLVGGPLESIVGSIKVKAPYRHVALYGGNGLVLCLIAGCAGLFGGAGSTKPKTEQDLGPTVGAVAQVIKPQEVPLEGFGLVAGLSGTGSAMCPPQVRAYLKQYILSQVPNGAGDLDELINSHDTAVVLLEADLPAAAMKGDKIDVQVSPVPGSDTISLRGGRLYLAELALQGTFGMDARTLATVEGPVFTNLVGTAEPSLKVGYILGGGQVLYDYVGVIRLRRVDFRLASAIRNRLNERYGPDVARAISPAEVEYTIPPQYRLLRERFIDLVGATYLTAIPGLTTARIGAALQDLERSKDKEASEITLEAFGRESLAGLVPLLRSADQEVRLRAARCMLYLHDDRALETLQAIVEDRQSPYRLEALEAIGLGGRREDAGTILRRFLSDQDRAIVLGAYEQLRRLGDPAVRQQFINRAFYLEQIPQAAERAIFVSRSGDPRIALFGTSLVLRTDVLAGSPDGMVLVDSRGRDYASVVRRYPSLKGYLPPLQSNLAVPDIVRTLGGDPAIRQGGQPAGLGASYSEIAALLEQISTGRAVDAQFWLGPLPKFERTVKK